jgi:hypothetical protein
MQLPSWIKISKPTKTQVQHDLYLVATAFVAAAISAWQVQPDKFSKTAAVAAVTAGIAAVITIGKSILTTL